MIAVTHALTMNGRIHGELKDPLDSDAEVIRKRLMLLDGDHRFSLSLWRLPIGIPFDRVNLERWPEEYIQVAGSRRRMTVEVRRLDGEAFAQYVVGRRANADRGRPAMVVPWNGHEAHVHPHEMFDAAGAADLFISYHADGRVPGEFSMRRLDL